LTFCDAADGPVGRALEAWASAAAASRPAGPAEARMP